MKVFIVLSLALLAIQIHSYDLYKFAVELPGAVCRTQSCTSSYMGNIGSYMLNMHGMWPDANDGSTIENCLTNNYDESQFTSTVLNAMNNDWVGLYSSSATFRSHEWGKHGTCWAQQNENPSTRRAFLGAGNLGTAYYTAMNDYFSKALSIKGSLNIEAAVFTSRNGDAQVSLSTLKSNLQSRLGVSNFDLLCSSNVLTEIRFCLDLDYAPIDCATANIQCSSSSPITIVGTIN